MPTSRPRRTVLLVDDDPNLGRGVKLALYSHRDRWDVQVVTSAEQAIALLERKPIDALITDARMPGMDGETLLRIAAERWPGMLRAVLSGEAGRDGFSRLRKLAHQFFAKPAAVPALFRRLEDSLEARARLSSPLAREIVCRFGALPAMPTTSAETLALAAKPDARIEDFVEVLERDPAVSGDVLRAVNSAWFGSSRPIGSLREAVRLLGTRPLCDLVVATQVFSGSSPRVERLRRDAVERVRLLPAFLSLLGLSELLEDVSTPSVLLDIGQLALELSAPREAARIAERVDAGEDRLVAERELIGADHALIGAVMLSVWALPPSLIETIALHHDPNVSVPSAASVLLLLSTLQGHAQGQCAIETLALQAEAHGVGPGDALNGLLRLNAQRAEAA